MSKLFTPARITKRFAVSRFFRDDAREPMHPAAMTADLAGSGGVPLATLGEEEPTFLAVSARRPARGWRRSGMVFLDEPDGVT